MKFDVIIMFYDSINSTSYYDSELIDDATLRQSLRLKQGSGGGLIIEDSNNRLVITDDFQHLIYSILLEAPNALKENKNYTMDFHYSPDTIEIINKGDDAIFNITDYAPFFATKLNMILGLEDAYKRYNKLMALVAADKK